MLRTDIEAREIILYTSWCKEQNYNVLLKMLED